MGLVLNFKYESHYVKAIGSAFGDQLKKKNVDIDPSVKSLHDSDK